MKTHLKIIIALSLALTGLTTFANDIDAITERSRLENVITELDYLQNFVNQTKNSIKENRDGRFNYSAFEADINVIKDAVKRYLNHHSTRPNKSKQKIEALMGEYKT